MTVCARRHFRRRRRGGYVLVVTLALLVLAATVTVGVSRAALQHAAAARDTCDTLQRHVGTRSLRIALLPRCESILAQAEAREHQPKPSVRSSIRLGNHVVDFIVSDEQAKSNVNAMLADAIETRSVEMRLVEAMPGGLGRAVRLRPAPRGLLRSDVAVESFPRVLGGIGQVFDLQKVAPGQLLVGRREQPAPMSLITLWGDGRVNLRRVSPAAAKLALSPMLSNIEINRLMEARNAPSTSIANVQRDPLRRLLEQANISESIGGRGLPVTLRSSCHSLWLIDNDGRRQWHEMAILDASEAEHPRQAFFAW
jgi:hypothetical protein